MGKMDINFLLKIIEIIAISAIPAIVFFISMQSTSYQIEQNEMEHQPSWDIGELLINNNSEKSSFQSIEIKYNENPFTLVNSSANFYVVIDIYPQKNYNISSVSKKFFGKNEYLTVNIPIYDFYGERGFRERDNNSIIFYPTFWSEEKSETPSYQSKYLYDFIVLLQKYMANHGIEGDIHINKCITITYVDVYKKWRSKRYISPLGGEFFEVDNLDILNSKSTDYVYFPSNISTYNPYAFFNRQIENIFKEQMNLKPVNNVSPKKLAIFNDDAHYSNGIIDYNGMIYENEGNTTPLDRIKEESSYILKYNNDSLFIYQYYQNRLNHAINFEYHRNY